jgi:hypothetical protein
MPTKDASVPQHKTRFPGCLFIVSLHLCLLAVAYVVMSRRPADPGYHIDEESIPSIEVPTVTPAPAIPDPSPTQQPDTGIVMASDTDPQGSGNPASDTPRDGDFVLSLGATENTLSVEILGVRAGDTVQIELWDGARRVAGPYIHSADAHGELRRDIELTDELIAAGVVQVSALVEDRVVRSPRFPLRRDETFVKTLVAQNTDAPSALTQEGEEAPSGDPTASSSSLSTGLAACDASPTAILPTCTPTSTPSPTATPTPTPTATPVIVDPSFPNWHAEYFNNPGFRGRPVVECDEPDLAFDWRDGSPAPGAVRNNWFSARWTKQIELPPGPYTFMLDADDWAEVRINGERVIVYGTATIGSRSNAIKRVIEPQEILNVEVRYVEYVGNAGIRFYWTPAAYHDVWQADYFEGPDLTGPVTYKETVEGLDLKCQWQPTESWPQRDSNDAFSVRWTRTFQPPLPTNDYTFCLYSFHGVRLWLNRELLIDHWVCDTQARFACRDVSFDQNSSHALRLDYFYAGSDQSGRLGFWTVPQRHEGQWIGAFFTNPRMSGTPAFVNTAPSLVFPPGGALKDPRLNDPQASEGYAIRWIRTVKANPGRHRIDLISDDGARLKVNQIPLIDDWSPGRSRNRSVTYEVLQSEELLVVEVDYFHDRAGDPPTLALTWHAPYPTPTATPTPEPTIKPTWTSTIPIPTDTPTRVPSATPRCCVTSVP